MSRTSRRNSVALVVLALLALIGLKVSSGMSRAGLIWGPNLPRLLRVLPLWLGGALC